MLRGYPLAPRVMLPTPSTLLLRCSGLLVLASSASGAELLSEVRPRGLGEQVEPAALEPRALLLAVSALVTTLVLVWLRSQAKRLKRRRARESWLEAAGISGAGEGRGGGASLPGAESRATVRSGGRAPRELAPSSLEVARTGDVLEVLGSFAAGVASDFGDQLTTILGHVDLLRSRHPEDADLHRSLDQIRIAAEQGRRSTRQLVAFGSRGLRRVAKHDLGALLRTAVRRVQLRSGGTIEVRVSPCALRIEGNAEELGIAIESLLQNAVEASPLGEVLVRCEAASGWEAEGLEEEAVRTFVRVSVLDDGPGLPDGVASQIFQPGFTSRPGARGLGLPLAFSMAARNGGRVVLRDARAHRHADRGTLAELYLRRTASAPRVQHEPSSVPSRSGTPRVLLVEDEDPVRNVVRSLLESAGYEVLAAATGEAALELEAEHRGALDLLLTDLCLPGISGLEIAERVFEQNPGMPIIYTSGVVEDQELEAQLLGSVPYFLQKPFCASELLDMAERCLHEARALEARRVLVVDDEVTSRRLVRGIVEADGLSCMEAGDGAEALEVLRRTRVDLVITDIVMPVLDGLDLCRAIHAGFPTVRVIAMSGKQAGRPGLRGAETFGAERVLTKPFSHDELSLAVRQALDVEERDDDEREESVA